MGDLIFKKNSYCQKIIDRLIAYETLGVNYNFVKIPNQLPVLDKEAKSTRNTSKRVQYFRILYFTEPGNVDIHNGLQKP